MSLFRRPKRPLETDMSGRTCLVTGSTDGHGKAMATALSRLGADVVLHARSESKVRALQEEITRDTGGKRPDFFLADLSCPEEIESACDEFLASGRPLHVLVNNAGLVGLERRTDAVGHELTFAVNYLAHFRMVLRLWPRLVECGPGRIVNISSDTYRIGSLDFDDLGLERRYSMARAYAQSKLAILYFTLEWARRTEGSGVTSNAVDPGPVASNIGADNPGLAYRLAGPMIKGLFPSAARAARTALWVATDPELAEASGGYYRSLARRENPLDFDPATSERLFRESLALCEMEDPLA